MGWTLGAPTNKDSRGSGTARLQGKMGGLDRRMYDRQRRMRSGGRRLPIGKSGKG